MHTGGSFSKTPVGTNYNKGATITLEADAFGAQPITWQWFRNKRPIAGVTQKEEDLTERTAELVVMTHQTLERAFAEALEEIERLPAVVGVRQHLPVED